MDELQPGEIMEIQEAYLGRDKKICTRLLTYKLTVAQTQERLRIRAQSEKLLVE
jgi:hypothetical protein